jgi:hypothetical protein
VAKPLGFLHCALSEGAIRMSIKIPRDVEKALQFVARDMQHRGETIQGNPVTAADLAAIAANLLIRQYVALNPDKAPELGKALGANERELDALKMGALLAESAAMGTQ